MFNYICLFDEYINDNLKNIFAENNLLNHTNNKDIIDNNFQDIIANINKENSADQKMIFLILINQIMKCKTMKTSIKMKI